MKYHEGIKILIETKKPGIYRVPGKPLYYKLVDCDNCGEKCFYKYRNNHKNKFCCSQCYSKYKIKIKTRKYCPKCKRKRLMKFFNKYTKVYSAYCKDCLSKTYKSEEYLEYHRKYKKTEKCKKRTRERTKKKYLNDPKYVIDRRMSQGIRGALKGKKAGRKWETLVGYTIEELYNHLEKTLPKGFTMDDLHLFHIDHIIPKNQFNYTEITDKEFKECWALENLQLLFAKDNLRKHAKLNYKLNKDIYN